MPTDIDKAYIKCIIYFIYINLYYIIYIYYIKLYNLYIYIYIYKIYMLRYVRTPQSSIADNIFKTFSNSCIPPIKLLNLFPFYQQI